jgi:hypothetical protein
MAIAVPLHTPYDGSSKLFAIGLKPLDPDTWIEVDRYFESYIAEKKRLYSEIPERIFAEEPDTIDAQREVLSLIEEHFQTHGTHFFGSPDRLADALAAAETVDAVSPLRKASLLVQEDLVLMRKGEGGWRLAAASLCFPSSWSLLEKFGKPLQDIHQPVPGFGPGTRMAELINRMFDSLKVEQPVERWNWSLQAGDDLYLPLSNDERADRAITRPSKFPDGDMAARAFMRLERQTLRKLPVSGDILFTIRIHLDPLSALSRHPDCAKIAESFAAQLAVLDEAQLDYKGLTADRGLLISILQDMAGKADAPSEIAI